MYRGIVAPHFSYCCSVWGCCNEIKLNSPQNIQNRAASWLPVIERIDFKILLLTFKALNNMAPAYLKDISRFQTSDRYKLRSEKSVTLMVPRTKFTSRGDRAFCTAAPKLWNKLPVEIRRSLNVHAFKTRLKTPLFDNYFNI